MLQQTQVQTVIPYFQRFISAFPDVATLARAEQGDVLALWSGLGYYARARNLHRAAQVVCAQFGGEVPCDMAALQALHGIGRSTAAAICALAGGQRTAILDGNVRRILARYFCVEGWPGNKAVEARLWQVSDAQLPQTDVAVYTQGLMDLGATVCSRSRPQCGACPLNAGCAALRRGRTGELPAPRPRKVLPQRRVVMLVLQQQARVCLQRRPERGIWGGLWSLPENADETGVRSWLVERGVDLELQALTGMVHVFTHFKLEIAPVLAVLPEDQKFSLPESMIWHDRRAIEGLGLPAPIRKILLALE